MPHAQRVIQALQSRYEVFIASAAMEIPTSFAAKYDWLTLHFPFIPPSHIVFCGDKGILRADFLIDDNPRQLRAFQGEGILFSSPSNAHVTGFRRVADWLDVERLFLPLSGPDLQLASPVPVKQCVGLFPSMRSTVDASRVSGNTQRLRNH
jgi:5'(3')-deoxyribonucleotidase